MLSLLIAYFIFLVLLSRFIARKGDNKTFFYGNRNSSWLMVAYGMVGASVSGISFVSVPGMVMRTDMTYLQMCLGFIAGYAVVAYLLLPLYYRTNAISIYSVLGRREDAVTASCFFILSDLLGSAVKFFLACNIMQMFVFDPLGIPFALSVPAMVLCIWLYTKTGGIRTLVYTDVLMTTLMLLSLGAILYYLRDILPQIPSSPHFRVFEFSDIVSPQHFLKQFLSGMFVVIVMTGLSQTMMQKNLTCKTLRDAQKDMMLSGLLFLPINFLFLALGIALTLYAQNSGLPLPASGDSLLPSFIQQQASPVITAIFMLGIIAAAFSSADSSLTTLTTSFCVDILRKPDDERTRKTAHIAVSALFVVIIYALQYLATSSLIDTIYIIVSYTYGPLLGLFAYRLSGIRGREVSVRSLLSVCLLSPILCYVLNALTVSLCGYRFGYELLLLNGAITLAAITTLRYTPRHQ
ncbi:MAG: sodium:solute symporter [Bacteroidaceae bacterium]|nr:sodium:solute symporter [Bacteroidaceae bacterium]